MRRPLFFAIPLILFGVFLRFHALDRQSLWDDEISTLRTISTPRVFILNRFASYETHPPLYFLQLKLWRAFHMRSLVKLRANSAFWGSFSLLLIYLVGRLYGGEALGLLSLAFLMISPFHLAYSQEMRPYAMAVTIALAALLTLERRAWVLLAFLWTAQLYTHYWGTFVVLAQAAYGYYSARSTRDRKMVLITAAVAGLLFVPWLPILRAQLAVTAQLVFWAPAFSIMNLAKAFVAYTGIFFNMASWTFFLPTHVWVLVLLGLSFAAAFWKGVVAGPRAALIWLSVGLGVPWLLSIWKPVIFIWYRYPVHMLPAFVLLIAAGLLSFRKPAVRLTLAVLVIGAQGWGCWIYFHAWQKANPMAVVQYVHWLRGPDTVVVRPVYFADLFSFYDQGTTAALDEHILDSPQKRAVLKGKRVILIVFDVPSDPIADAFLSEFKPLSARYFPGTAHLGITVYQLR